MPVGERPGEATLQSLRVQGLRWALWKPFPSSDLCFGAGLALQTNDPGDPRQELRVPCSRPIVVEAGGRKRAAVLRDLSPTGAFVAFADALQMDEPLLLRVRLPDGEFPLPGRVAWRRSERSPGAGADGVGLRFDPLDEEATEALRSFVSGRIDAFRI
jgi:hypothetical protein